MEEKKRILIADYSMEPVRNLFKDENASHFDIKAVTNGPDCLREIKEFKPDIILIDLLLPQMHGIEILKKIKENETTKKIGVIIATSYPTIQNYHAAVEEGADYFLIKPIDPHYFFLIAERFFAEGLTPDPFAVGHLPYSEYNTCYNPAPSTCQNYLKFWGTRGSSPVAGSEYIRYGGNTCCIEICSGEDRVIIDAGTGIRSLGNQIQFKESENIQIFIGHTHWDHITGFPFFQPLYKKNQNIQVWAPVGFEKNAKDLFTDMLAYAYFPVRLDEMHAKLTFKELRDGRKVSVGNIVINTHYTNHPGPTFGFKIKTKNETIGYISDNEMLFGYHGHPRDIDRAHPLLEPHQGLLTFLQDCTILIHEAQYFQKEYQDKVGWGHSSIGNATALVQLLDCKEWIVTHHDPKHSDANLQEKTQIHIDTLKECQITCRFQMAYDGLIIPI